MRQLHLDDPGFLHLAPIHIVDQSRERRELGARHELLNLTIPTYGYLGASFQCSIIDGGWQFNGQHSPGWTNFSSTGHSSMTKINHDCQFPFGTLATSLDATQQSFTVTPNVTGSVTAATVEPGMILLIDNEEILCTAASGNTCTASRRGWAGTGATTHAAGALYMGSVHVQYHVTFDPGQNACLLNGKSGAPVECVFIDYMILNNVKFDFHALFMASRPSTASPAIPHSPFRPTSIPTRPTSV